MHKEKFAQNPLIALQIGFVISLNEVTELASEKWGKEIGEMHPSFFPRKNDNIMVFNPEKGKTPRSQECLEFLKCRDLFLPNVHGLVVLELLDTEYGFLPNSSWTMGYDYIHHLHYEKNFGHFVPYLRKDGEGSYEQGWFPWGSVLEHDETLLGFRREG